MIKKSTGLLVASLAVADPLKAHNFDGWRAGETLGYINQSAQLKDVAKIVGKTTHAVSGKDKKGNGISLAGTLEYGKEMTSNLYLGLGGAFGYDAVENHDGDRFEEVGASDMIVQKYIYKPNWRLSGFLKFGYLCTPSIMAFIKLGTDVSFGKVSVDRMIDFDNNQQNMSVRTMSFTPEIGIDVAFEDDWSMQVSAAYRVTKQLSQFGETFKKRPRAIITKFGFSRKFNWPSFT